MKLNNEKLSAECPGFQDSVSLNLDCQRLARIPAISRCRALQYISARCNQLTSIEELVLCPKLWVIDVLQNQLSDISSLANFQVLGWLNVNCNNLTLKSLEPLKSVHIISLEFYHPKIQRSEILALLPHIWILNEVYVTQSERPVKPVMNKLMAFGASLAAEYIRKFTASMTEKQKFEHLIYELEKLCELEWEMKNKKTKHSKFPKFQLCRWKDIKSASKLVLASLFYLYLEGFYNVGLVKEVVAIIVTESYPENTPLIEAIELCELKPHYLLSFIMYLCEFADSNTLWKKINVDYLIRNFSKVQKNWGKKGVIIDVASEPLIEQMKIIESRQQIALFVLTALIKFEIVSQIIASKDRKIGNYQSLEKLLEYAKVDEATLLFNISEPQKPIALAQKGDIRSSIISYSRSLQNLRISENTSSRYSTFLIKTKTSSKSHFNEEADMINKFEELNTIKKNNSRVLTAEKISQDALPPLIPTAKYSHSTFTESSKEQLKPEPVPLKSSQIFSSDSSEKLEFILTSNSYLKNKKDWRSIQAPPLLYSLSESQTSFKLTASQKSLAATEGLNRYIPNYFFEEVLKVTIEPCDVPGRIVEFKIEYLTEKTFLTRIDIQDTQKTKIEEDQEKIEIAYKKISKEISGNKKWYPVPKRIRFVVDDNFVQNLKPCNFYEEHKELLPPIPERVCKKPTLMLQGKPPESTKVTKEILKDQEHLIRVITREKTPWVGYQLKPTTKIRHDVFCANYGELLKYESEKEKELSAVKRFEKFKKHQSSSPNRICEEIYEYLNKCFN